MAIQLQKPVKSRAVASVSMAPMIDMVFLLLVFFMTASAMSQAGNKLELDLPESSSAEVAKDFSDRLIVSVDASGQAHLGAEAISSAALQEALSHFSRSRLEGKLNIRAAKDTPFSAVKEVMKAAAAAGIDDYLYSSYQGGED